MATGLNQAVLFDAHSRKLFKAKEAFDILFAFNRI